MSRSQMSGWSQVVFGAVLVAFVGSGCEPGTARTSEPQRTADAKVTVGGGFGWVRATTVGAPGTPADAGLYRKSRVIWFDWTPPTEGAGTVAAYRIQVGTSPGNADVLDDTVGTALAHYVIGKHLQTLYARVAAIDVSGVQGPWSASSDGIKAHEPMKLPGTLFVAKTGNDANDGTAGRPLATVSKAVSLAGAGDVVDVGPGTYHEQVVIPKGGTRTDPLIIRGRGAIIDGAARLKSWRHDGVVSAGPAPCRLFSAALDPSAHRGLLARDGSHHAPTQLFLDGDSRLQTLPMPPSFTNGKGLSREQSQDASLCLSQARPGTWWWLDGNHASDLANRVFVCLAPDDGVVNHIVEIPLYNTAFSATDGHVHIEGFSIKRFATSGISVLARRDDQDVVVVNNAVRLISGSRVITSGDLPNNPKTVWGPGSGIIVRVGQKALIARNTVADIAYYGIHFLINNQKQAGPRPGYLHVASNTVQRVTPHPFGVSRAHEGGQAMGGTNGSMYNVVERNTIRDARYGIWFDSAFGSKSGTGESVVRHNKLFDVEKAIFFERGTFRCTAQRNIVVGAKIAIKLGTGQQVAQEADPLLPTYQADRCRVVHNTILNSNVGVSLDYASAPVVRNNIVAAFDPAKSPATGVVVGASSQLLVTDLGMARPSIDHNLYDFGAITSSFVGCVGSTARADCATALETWRQRGYGAGSLQTAAGLRGDYRLRFWSPAIDSGVDVGLDDYCGPPDIGALERCY